MSNLIARANPLALPIAKDDPFRPQYHVSPNVGLMNDPNGVVEFNGKFHLFYQWNPFTCTHGAKFWGHFISDDMVNWQAMPVALAPDQDFDRHGCYSGSAIVHNDTLYLLYTANLKKANAQRVSSQCLVKSKDGLHFERVGIVIEGPPSGYTAHFRDPKIWQENDMFYAVIGAQTTEEQGHCLLYSSPDLHQWQCLGPIAGSKLNGLGEFGFMWECPDIVRFDEKTVLICSPQGVEPEQWRYQNLYQSGYFIGQGNWQSPCFEHGAFNELDRGFEFYAPQTMQTSDGRTILYAWIGMPEHTQEPSIEYDWLHMMSLPRELTLDDNCLYQRPIRELQNLRRSHHHYHQQSLTAHQEISFDQVQGRSGELLVEWDKLTAPCELKLLANTAGQYTSLRFDPTSGMITLDRSNSGQGYQGQRQCKLPPSSSLHLHIFIDRSCVEIFINEGQEVFTARVFPDKNATRILFVSQADSQLSQLDYYTLEAIPTVRS